LLTPQLCTYFDVNYLARGLALFSSVRRYWHDAHLTALCLDDQTFEILSTLQLPGLRALPLGDLLTADPELAACRSTRSRLAFYYTCTASLMLHVLHRAPTKDAVIYLDSDLYFFAPTAPLLEELSTGSILVHRHRLRGSWPRAGNGDFNLGMVAHRSTEEGLACLKYWRTQCLASCDDHPVNDRWGDQQYLEEWPARYPDLVVSRHAGAGVAPWNLADYRLHLDPRGRVMVDDEPLLFFHFHGLVQARPGVVCTRLDKYDVRLGAVARRHIYRPYVRAVTQAAGLIRARTGRVVEPFGTASRADWRESPPVSFGAGLGDVLRQLHRARRGDLLLVPATLW
jgi:hypothetical protein